MRVKSLRPDLQEYIQAHTLGSKWEKVCVLFETSIRHPSLHTELLEPKWRGIYSFRIDRRYRALFFVRDNTAEIIAITNHYKK